MGRRFSDFTDPRNDPFASSRVTLTGMPRLPQKPRTVPGILLILILLVTFAAAFGGSYYALGQTGIGQSFLGFATATPGPTLTALPVVTAPPVAATATSGPPTLRYYGASLDGMRAAIGVTTDNTIPDNAPWPQASGNYCSLATTQGLINYVAWANQQPLPYPTRVSTGPATFSSTPGDPTQAQPGQLLYVMDHQLAANFTPGLKVVSSGRNRKPFTLANTSHDSGLDPRSIAVAVAYATANRHPYHQHIFHNGADATARHVAAVTARYSEPVILPVNRGEHAVLIAGVWSIGNPATDPNAQIESFAVYSPWDQRWGYFLNGTYYERVPYKQFVSGASKDGATWLSRPYALNDGYDPDPYMGPYQAGQDQYSGATANPQAHFWLGNNVTIERDEHDDHNPDNAYNEADQLMLGP